MISVATVASLLVLLIALGGVLLVIAADKTRYLTRFDLTHWNDRIYLAQLPNFLQHVHDHGYTSPWPARLDAVSAGYFKHQLRGILSDRPGLERHDFIKQHLNLQALLFILKPFLDDAVLAEQAKIVATRVLDMADSADRDRLTAFVDNVRNYRAAFIGGLTKYDRQIIREMQERDFLGTLRSANAMFHEHGYDNLLPELDMLRRWRTLEGCELAQELPRLPKVGTRGSASNYVGLIHDPDSNPGR